MDVPAECSLAFTPYPSITINSLPDRNSSKTLSAGMLDYSLCSVVCMNCEEFIDIDKIESHSYLCTSVSQKVKQLNKSPLTIKIKYSLSKLESCLIRLQQRPNLAIQDRSDLALILRLCQILIENESADDFQATIKSIRSVTSSIKKNQYLRLYADRLLGLANSLMEHSRDASEITTKKQICNVRSPTSRTTPRSSFNSSYRSFQSNPFKVVERISSNVDSLDQWCPSMAPWSQLGSWFQVLLLLDKD